MNSTDNRVNRRFKRLIFSVLPALLLVAAFVPVFLSVSMPAGAVSVSEQAKLIGYVNSYIVSQFQNRDEGEAGYLVDSATLKSRIDSNNNIGSLGTAGVLGEGDDASTAPVLVDVLVSSNDVIPASSARCLWNGTTGNGCLESAQVNFIQSRVNAHRAAGFSTDVITYCATGHTESPVTGGFGYIAQAGGLGNGAPPKVFALKWGRNGWKNTAKAYPANNTPGSPTATSSYTPPNPIEACTGSTPDSELVRCAALWAVNPSGGNVGNGVPTWSQSSGQAIDLRTGDLTGKAIVNPVAGSNTIQIPVNTVFNTGMSRINPANPPKKLFVGRTQHIPGIVAEGAEMIGYDSTFLQWGMPNYNGTLDEKWVSSGITYPVVAATASNLTSGIDVMAPIITSGPAVSGITSNSADISRVTHEPSTSKIHLVGSDSHVVQVNDTVLNASKTVTMSGLHAGVSYTGTLTAYDGQANGTSSTIGSFTTPVPPPLLEIQCPPDQVIAATGPSGAVATFGCTATGGVDPAPVVVCSPASGSTFPVGTTVVNCTVADSAGNTASCSHIVTVVLADSVRKPDLALMDDATGYWGSYADYVARELSVVLHIKNRSTYQAYDVAITGSTNIGGANLLSPVPTSLGNIAAGDTASVTLRYFIPVGRNGILVRLQGCASDVLGNSYTYP